MKVGNRPIASAYLEHACTGIPIRDFSSLHFLRSEGVRRAQSSFKSFKSSLEMPGVSAHFCSLLTTGGVENLGCEDPVFPKATQV